MTENMKKFLELVSKNDELSKKMNDATKEDVLALAKELGIELTEADFEQQSAELSDDELDTVVGGGHCVCVGSGGGTADSVGERPCACITGGGGEWDSPFEGRQTRCACVWLGYGDDI